MKERLLKFLNTIGLSSSRFADEIGIQPSGVSHILSGRNNPGYDFIVKILTKYPDLNSDWLLLGKGEMFKTNAGQADLFDKIDDEDLIPQDVTNVKSENFPSYTKSENRENAFAPSPAPGKAERIVMFYSDGSYKEYFPG